MKRISICLFVIFCSLNSFAQKQVVVDPNAEMRTLNKSFNAIKVSEGIDIYLSQSDKESIAVSASDENLKKDILTVVEDNTLKISVEGNRSWSKKNRKMSVYISFVNLTMLDASGASDISISGTINVPSLKLNLSGSSDFKGAVSVTDLVINLSGASDVTISGKASTVNIESSGASDLKGFDLTTDVCNARASGASDINVTVNKQLTASASGASNIYYHGEGKLLEVKSSGASTVSKKG